MMICINLGGNCVTLQKATGMKRAVSGISLESFLKESRSILSSEEKLAKLEKKCSLFQKTLIHKKKHTSGEQNGTV